LKAKSQQSGTPCKKLQIPRIQWGKYGKKMQKLVRNSNLLVLHIKFPKGIES
jgi:hypothetical protein